MNDYNATQSPSFSAPTKKPFPTVWVVLGVVVLLLALAIVGGIRAFKFVSAGSSEAIAVGNRFVESMGRHDYQTAQSLFTVQVQATTPPGNLKDIETLLEKHHGAYVSHGQPEWNVQNWNGQTSVRLAYPARFTKSASTISLLLVQTDKGYRVSETHYDF